MPDWILTDELRWLRFLEEGYDNESGWSPKLLDRDKASNLHVFIQREYGDERYRGTLHGIAVHVGEAPIM